MVKPDINKAADLKGKVVASPQLGNTQDVALRTWLKGKGLSTDTAAAVTCQSARRTMQRRSTTFKTGDIQGAWVPEPWATRLVTEGGGKFSSTKRALWPKGQYVTTQIIVTTDFLKEHPDTVQQLVNAQVASNDYIKTNTADVAVIGIATASSSNRQADLGDLVIASFKNIDVHQRPDRIVAGKVNKDAKALGFPAADSLKGLYDLSFLNKALKAAGEPTIPAAKT